MYRTFYNDFFNMMFLDPIYYTKVEDRGYRSYLPPSPIYVVSEERIKELELKKQERTLESIDKKIEELQAYRQSIESPTAEDASVCGTVEPNS